MRASALVELYEYHYWANPKLFGVLEQLTPEQFTQSVAGSYGSIRNTLVHVVSAEWGWLDRCGGPKRGKALNPADYDTLDSLLRVSASVEGYMRTFVGGLTDDDLAQPIEFSLGGPTHCLSLGELLHHAAIHAAHHRGQISLLLRTLGVVPGNFDMLIDSIERAHPAPQK